MENELLDFELTIDKEEYSSFTGGENGYTFYLKIFNKSNRSREINISNTTYITKNREQIEQDKWLSGLLILNGTIRPNAFSKAGLIYYKNKLKEISNEDSLFCNIGIVEEGKELRVEFIRQSSIWNIINVEVGELKNQSIEVQNQPNSPTLGNQTVIAKELLKKIERFEAFEEELKVYFDKISIEVYHENWFKILGEIYSASGIKLERNVYVRCVLYDSEGLILDEVSNIVIAEDFMGFYIFKFSFQKDGIANVVKKIRIYPAKR